MPAARHRRDRPPADDADGPVRRPRRSSPTSSPTAARRASTCGAWTARASTRWCSTRRSGLFVPFLPSLSAARVGRRRAARTTSGSPSTGRSIRTRLTGVALVPTADIALAVLEAEHAAALGLPGVMVRPNPLYGRDLGEPRRTTRSTTRSRQHDLTLVGARGPRCDGPDDRPRPGRDVRAAPRDEPSRWSRWPRWAASCCWARSNGTRACGSRSSSRAPGGCRTGSPGSTGTRSGWRSPRPRGSR